jgi:hypothetical protein
VAGIDALVATNNPALSWTMDHILTLTNGVVVQR